MADLQDQGSPQPNVSELQISGRFWMFLVVTGVAAGVAGGLLMKLLRLSQHLSYRYQAGDFEEAIGQVSSGRHVAVMVLAGLVAGAVLYGTKRMGVRTGADLSVAVWTKSGQMRTVSTLISAVLSIVTVGMGVALGREGALKSAGAVAANKVSDWTGLTLAERRVLVACGAGAGMAAAYNVPLGGALFVAEVLLGSLNLSTVMPAFVATFSGVAASWILLPDQATYSFPTLQASPSLIVWSILAGPVLGLLSVGYVRVIAWAQMHKPKGWRMAVTPLVIFSGVGVVAMKFPQILGNGKGIVQLTFDDKLGAGLLCWLIVLRPMATVLCLRSGSPGGLFTPTMTLGALFGDGLGSLWKYVMPGPAIASYALIGSAGFLAAATLGPVSSAVFLLELTRHADSLMVPLLITTVGATVTARRCDIRSIYSAKLLTPKPEG